VQGVRTTPKRAKSGKHRDIYVGTDTQPLGHMTTCFEYFGCGLLQGKVEHVDRQSRQAVGVEVELPVGEEGDTRSDSHP
jgi:hypothetical protein